MRKSVRVRYVAALFAAVSLLAARPQPRPAAPLVFEAPAGSRPAGALDPADAFSRILPSGRLIVPEGASAVVGVNARSVALTPDGRYAIVANADDRQGGATSTLDRRVRGGSSLAVVEVATMRLIEQDRAPEGAVFSGVVALADPLDRTRTLVFASSGASDAVLAFDLDAEGHLVPDRVPSLAMPPVTDASLANAGRAFPGALVPSKTGARLYVVNSLANTIVTIDVASRALAGSPVPVGYFPFGAASAGDRLIVSNEGLASYRRRPSAVAQPDFRSVRTDRDRSSTLSAIVLGAEEMPDARRVSPLALDPPPDALPAIGGAHPTAVVATRDGRHAFVALTNVDRIAAVNLEHGRARFAGSTDLRLSTRAPYGTQPVALALSSDQRRLYVALAGLNAVAVLDVRDPAKPRRIGLLPTGWSPSALALSADNKTVFVANAKGVDREPGSTGDNSAVWATLQKIDLGRLDLARVTRRALTNVRVARKAAVNPIVPQGFMGEPSRAIKHVVLIVQEGKSYDAMLGDLADAAGNRYGNGDPALVAFGESITPNLHALARTYGLATNFFAEAADANAGHQVAAGGIATAFSERGLRIPEDYPRSGYLFDTLARKRLSYRDYGDLVWLAGYDAARDDVDGNVPLPGLGGLYSFDVPAPAALAGHIDLDYPGWNVRVRDTRRAQEFSRDFYSIAIRNAFPAFTHIWLPSEDVADSDQALGTIVDFLTHLPQWKETAIFVMPSFVQPSRDHVHASRSFALVISPFAKLHYLGGRHLSTASVVKTEEELLGLPPLSLGDALATDLRDFFTTTPAATPYTRFVPSALPAPAPKNSTAAPREGP
jgi:YVTN family beta-propeller protein